VTGSSPQASPGQILGGKYRVDGVLSEGCTTLVLAATELESQRPVAIKLLRPSELAHAHSVERFRREAHAVSRLRSPHLAVTYDVGELGDGCPYIAMELLAGMTLADKIHRDGPAPERIAVEHVLQAARAVAAAHALGIVHRDLKPKKLFLAQVPGGGEMVKVLDFGFSSPAVDRSTDEVLTAQDETFGSPHHISPEQLRSARNVDYRTDIWSLGIILYELVAGRPPFDASSLAHLSLQVMGEDPPPLTAASPALQRVVKRCLEKEPDARYRNVAALIKALERVLDPTRGASANAAGSPGGLSESVPTPPMSGGATVWIILTVAILVVLAVGAWLMLR
jgi:serine/threonine-protein kinase